MNKMNNGCKSMINNSHNNRPINPFAIHFIHAVSRPTPPQSLLKRSLGMEAVEGAEATDAR